ncbi:hypothetical protein D3C71_1520480 [compost metagenome]
MPLTNMPPVVILLLVMLTSGACGIRLQQRQLAGTVGVQCYVGSQLFQNRHLLHSVVKYRKLTSLLWLLYKQLLVLQSVHLWPVLRHG